MVTVVKVMLCVLYHNKKIWGKMFAGLFVRSRMMRALFLFFVYFLPSPSLRTKVKHTSQFQCLLCKRPSVFDSNPVLRGSLVTPQGPSIHEAQGRGPPAPASLHSGFRPQMRTVSSEANSLFSSIFRVVQTNSLL